jgi:hypothetical protein
VTICARAEVREGNRERCVKGASGRLVLFGPSLGTILYAAGRHNSAKRFPSYMPQVVSAASAPTGSSLIL